MGCVGAKQSTDTLDVRVVHRCDGGANLVEVNILAGEGLSKLRDLWTERRGDRRRLGVSDS